MIDITEKEFEKLRECLKQIKNDKDRDEIGEKVIRLYETLETCELSEVFRHVLKGYNLDENIAKSLEEDKKPFLKLPANVRYKLLSRWSVASLQDMKNQERRKGNIESDETIVYLRKEGNETYETRVSTYSIEANCWQGRGKCEKNFHTSNEMTDEYIFTMLKYDKDGSFKMGYTKYLQKCEDAGKARAYKKYIDETNEVSQKYAKIREKYFEIE